MQLFVGSAVELLAEDLEAALADFPRQLGSDPLSILHLSFVDPWIRDVPMAKEKGDQDGQRAIGIIRLDLRIDEMRSSASFHIIDAKTTYNMLLGRPWIHDNRVIPSTLHQCFKYCQDNVVKKVIADDKPFGEAESYMADAKFYLASKGSQSPTPPSTLEIQKKVSELRTSKDDTVTMEDANDGGDWKIKNDGRLNDKVASTSTPVLRYAPRPRKEEDCSFKGLTVPVTSFERTMVKAEAVECVKDDTMTIEGFNPKAYKLFVKAGYSPQEPSPLGKLLPEVTGKKLHGLTPTQCMLKQKGFQVLELEG